MKTTKKAATAARRDSAPVKTVAIKYPVTTKHLKEGPLGTPASAKEEYQKLKAERERVIKERAEKLSKARQAFMEAEHDFYALADIYGQDSLKNALETKY